MGRTVPRAGAAPGADAKARLPGVLRRSASTRHGETKTEGRSVLLSRTPLLRGDEGPAAEPGHLNAVNWCSSSRSARTHMPPKKATGAGSDPSSSGLTVLHLGCIRAG